MQIIGEEVEKNVEQGVALLTQAAIKGDIDARVRLGILHINDDHGKNNLQLAYFWFTVADEKNPYAKQGLATVNAEIKPD